MLAALAGLQGCVRAATPDAPPRLELVGLSAPLRGDPTLRLLLDGKVLGQPAQVELELASPLTAITLGCFATPPEPKGTVRVQGLNGGWESLPEVPLPAAEVDGRALSSRPVAVISGSSCRLILGSDLLGAYALHFDPQRWTLTLQAPGTREDYRQLPAPDGFEHHLLPLTKDPSTDRLLVPVQLQAAGGRELVSTFILTTARARSALGVAPARAAGMESDAVIARRLVLPTPAARQLQTLSTFSLERLQLSPELSLAQPTLDGLETWTQTSAVGLLGPDVWGRFETTIDPTAQVMVLRRPRMGGEPRRRTCGPAGTTREESCFSLQALPLPEGLRATVTVWRDLPEGGRIYLEAVDADGAPVRAPCQLGVNLPPSDRGASLTETLPWPELTKAFPACGVALQAAVGIRPVLFEEGADPQCAGQCAFALHPRGRGIVCSCATAPGGGAPGATERNLELFRRFRDQELRRQTPVPLPDEPEPQD